MSLWGQVVLPFSAQSFHPRNYPEYLVMASGCGEGGEQTGYVLHGGGGQLCRSPKRTGPVLLLLVREPSVFPPSLPPSFQPPAIPLGLPAFLPPFLPSSFFLLSFLSFLSTHHFI